MKSPKQARAEIKQARLVRAVQQAAGYPAALHAAAGAVAADTALLARINHGCGHLPAHYADRAFHCIDCGAQQVWTGKQQKWWYEVIQAPIESRAVRCLSCRRQRRAALARARAGAGAYLLRDEVQWLRSVDRHMRDADTVQRVEAALSSKWQGVRKVAIEVLGRWRRPRDAALLRSIVEDDTLGSYDPVRRAAAQAVLPLLAHPGDDGWALQAYVRYPYAMAAVAPFIATMDARTLNAFIDGELQRNEEQRLYHLGLMLMHARRQPGDSQWAGLRRHPSAALARLWPHVSASIQGN